MDVADAGIGGRERVASVRRGDRLAREDLLASDAPGAALLLEVQHHALIELAGRAIGSGAAYEESRGGRVPRRIGMPPVDAVDAYLGLVDRREEGEEAFVARADRLLAPATAPAKRLLLEPRV